MGCDSCNKRIAVVQRVIFHYRVGLFQEMSQKWEVKVFYGDSVTGTKVINAKPPYPFQTQKLFTIHKKSRKNPQQILFFNPGLVLRLLRWRPDIILLEGSNNMLNNIVIYLFCKLFRKKYIWWGIGRVPGRKDSLYRKTLTPFRKLLIRQALAVLAYCNLSAEYFSEITDSNKIWVFPNSLNNKAIEKEIIQVTDEDKDALRKKVGLPPNCVTLLYVGAMEYNKRLEILLDAFKILEDTGYNVKLLLIGSGCAEQSFRSYAEKINVRNCVFLGKIITGINMYFQIADIFVLPGRGGLAVNQALINGLPVVCNTPADGTELDMIVNGYNGFLLEKMTAKQLVDCLVEMIEDNKYSDMGKNSRNIVEEQYNIDAMLKVLGDVVTGCA
ncbi:hypothetical protein DRJ25_04570 [Candidatus Woesearchaeota archaeon]|nr:MAG: hypothetical protein DRJ25_04570 [Candidatus Woesearchaeota archaeon]